MRTEKINFKNIKNVLSRDEMKKIMAGSGEGCGSCTVSGQSYACSKGPVTGACICGMSDKGSCS